MANAADFRAEISKGLECSICISILHEPKVLQCHHWFCKTCIDELLEFNNDGSAVINCPMKCKRYTVLEKNQTTDDLPIPYQLTSLLDVLDIQNKNNDKGDENEDIRCCGTTDDGICKNKVSSYCSTCSMMMCNSCCHKHSDNHNHDKEKKILSVKSDKRSDKLMMICEEHSTFAKYICCKNKFICIYCKHRHHRMHESTSLQVEADQIREFLCSDEINIDNLENGIQNTIQVMNETQKSIDHSREKLEISLKNLKAKRLSEFLLILNKEESNTLSKFDKMVDNHKNQFPDVITKDYFKDIMKMHDIEIISEREKIMKNIFSYTSNELTFPAVEIEFLENNDSLKNSLGKLKIEVASPMIHTGIPTSTFKSNIKLIDNSEIIQQFELQLKEMVEMLIDANSNYENKHPNSFIVGSLEKEITEELPGSTKSCTAVEKSDISNDENSINEFELDETFDSLKEQLCESVDLQFGSILKVIQDQFILTEGLDIGDISSEELDEDVGETDDLNDTDGQYEDESREEIEQTCNQS